MSQLDIVEPAMKAYKVVWAERQYLLRLAMVPMLIKFICLSLLTLYGWEAEFLKGVLIMLPSYFAEGWLLSHLIRLIYYGHRWPFRPTGDMDADMVTLAHRARGVMAGTLTYVLTRYLVDGFVGAMQAAAIQAQEQVTDVPPEPSFGSIFLAIMMFSGMLWGFRLLWLYLPAALNRSMKLFLSDINRFIMSLYMIGIWLMSIVPVILVFHIISGIVFGPEAEQINAAQIMIFNMLRTVGDTAIWMLSTAAMSYGLLTFLSEKHRT